MNVPFVESRGFVQTEEAVEAAPESGGPRDYHARPSMLAERWSALAIAVLALTLSATITTIARAAPKKPKPSSDTLGLRVPRGSRLQSDQQWASSRGFRPTVRFYERLLKRKHLAYELVPVYRYRGVAVARFLSRDPASRWLAIHVFRRRGRTRITLVPRPPADTAAKDH